MTYIDVNELAARLSYDPHYITNRLRPERLTEGRHFVWPFGGRKVLYIWEAIEEDMLQAAGASTPMTHGGISNG